MSKLLLMKNISTFLATVQVSMLSSLQKLLYNMVSDHGCMHCRLQENYNLLKTRLSEIMKSKLQLEEDLKTQCAENRLLVVEMNALKPDVKRLYKMREQHKKCVFGTGKSLPLCKPD